jgi:hypothetical protein
MGGNNGNGNGGTHVAKDDRAEHLADEDTPRDQGWKSGDFKNPETVKLALIEVSSYAEEAIRNNRANAREVRRIAKEQGALTEGQGQMMAVLARIDRRTELTEERTRGLTFKLGRNEELTEAHREWLREHEKRIEAIQSRNDKIDAEEAAKHARLEAAVANLKEDVEDLEEEVEGSKNQRIVTAEQATATLAAEVFRAKLASVNDEARDTRADFREEKRHHREESSKLKWWALGIVGAIVLAGAAAGIGRITGKTVELVPLPTPASSAGHH